jgi:uncharacterized protein
MQRRDRRVDPFSGIAGLFAPWTQELEAADVVINLAGKSVNCRYGKRNRREIMESRVDSVRAIRRAMEHAKRPPRVWLQAATATIYAHRFGVPNDEFTGLIGGQEPDVPDTWRFNIDVAKAWESAVNERGNFAANADRNHAFRHDHEPPPRRNLCSFTRARPIRSWRPRGGDGRQFVSWIHEYDFVRAVRFLIENEICGIVNVCSPNRLPNSEFMRDATGVGNKNRPTGIEMDVGDWCVSYANRDRVDFEEPTRGAWPVASARIQL